MSARTPYSLTRNKSRCRREAAGANAAHESGQLATRKPAQIGALNTSSHEWMCVGDTAHSPVKSIERTRWRKFGKRGSFLGPHLIIAVDAVSRIALKFHSQYLPTLIHEGTWRTNGIMAVPTGKYKALPLCDTLVGDGTHLAWLWLSLRVSSSSAAMA
ncbi:hypothetical protein C2857_006988 [Epichloe festucae Fl1]|uniref:Uncharacterized protein n=1 Tax=Epichloe festucae (strain Fl1) TaxID=877507 RepID=A0A7S9KQC7_EPIFF|nr:hypothetical protein C2857_006988 [Epichloe festucae Fl1]